MDTEKKPPVPVPSAALILVRESAGRFQVYLLRRSAASGFMPGSFVFPGGLVDAHDRDHGFWRGRVDLAPDDLVRRLGDNDGFDVLAHAVAAVRETFEESRALFAGRRNADKRDYENACAIHAGRRAGHGWFNRLAEDGGWVLHLSALSRWERWVTPLAMPRRFDTRFFIAVLPEGQQCRPDRRETTEGVWLKPREALSGNLSGTVPLTPPGLATLQELLQYPTLAALQAAAATRVWSPGIMPRLLSLPAPRQALILMPWDPHYDLEAAGVVDRIGDPRVLRAGEPFSRVWNDGSGVWRPVRFGPGE
jgi:hypothetical protein